MRVCPPTPMFYKSPNDMQSQMLKIGKGISTGHERLLVNVQKIKSIVLSRIYRGSVDFQRAIQCQ